MLNQPNLLDVAVDMMQPDTSAHETSFFYNGARITFQKGADVMVNATEMAKSFEKRPAEWLRLPGTSQFVATLLAVRKSHRSNFIKTINGVGTWFHQDVALEFARWLSPEFAIWTNDRIKELLTTGVATVRNDDEMIANAMLILQKRLDAHRQQVQILEGQTRSQQEKIKELAPKAEYTDEVLQSKLTYTMTQMSKELDFSSVGKFTHILKDKGIMYKQSGQWMLTVKYAGNGYTKSRTFSYLIADDSIATNTITVWTENGRAFLHQLRKEGRI